MSNIADIEGWLEKAGYEYHCYISWAHTKNIEMTNCARELYKSIKSLLGIYFVDPKIFMDERSLNVGTKWEQKIKQTICKSVSMVAICGPMYYHSAHKWCGIEWATMDTLSDIRLSGCSFKAIIPILLRNGNYLPDEVRKIQYIDFSRAITQGRYYFRTQDFRDKIEDIIYKIMHIARAIVNNNSKAECSNFTFPTISAFENYKIRTQPFPFRGDTLV